MKRYNNSEKCPEGMYLNLSSFEFVQVTGENPALPAGGKGSYVKVPLIFAMVAGPVSGLLFILFIPFIGIAGILGFFGYKAWNGVYTLTHRTAQLANVSYEPGRAYFNQGDGTADADEKELEEIKKKVDERRSKGEN